MKVLCNKMVSGCLGEVDRSYDCGSKDYCEKEDFFLLLTLQYVACLNNFCFVWYMHEAYNIFSGRESNTRDQ